MLRDWFSESGKQVSEGLIQDVFFRIAVLGFETKELLVDLAADVRAQSIGESPMSMLIAPLGGNLAGHPDDDHDAEKRRLSEGKVCPSDSRQCCKHRLDLLCEDLVILCERFLVAHFGNKHFDKHH